MCRAEVRLARSLLPGPLKFKIKKSRYEQDDSPRRVARLCRPRLAAASPYGQFFGALRVLNDDTVAPGEGFGTHPHDNMEIVSIALEGALRHGDSMGNMKVLRPGEIQVMSAGTGITHSEMNASETEPVKFLQIWVLTDAQDHTPRYNQVELAPAKRNVPHVIVAPEGRGGEHVGWVHQDAWFYTLDLDKDRVVEYRMNTRGHGAYVFVIEGSVEAAGEELGPRDGMGITGADEFPIKGETDAKVLIIEVPMEV